MRDRVNGANMRVFGETATIADGGLIVIFDTDVGLPKLRESQILESWSAAEISNQTHLRLFVMDSSLSRLADGVPVIFRGIEYIVVDIGASNEGLTPVDLMRHGYELEEKPEVDGWS